MNKRVVLGFSGGIDSFASVGILQKQGYEVIALTLDTTGNTQMVSHAIARAKELGIEHIVVDIQEMFKNTIIDYFANEYMRGRTPAPCTICNSNIKWRLLKEYADKLDCDHIATGHYFRIEQHNGLNYICRADDAIKDQSYYLWGVPQDMLSRVVTPMADIIKQNIMSALPTEKKVRESMGVCFLNGCWYGDILKDRFGDTIHSGEIIDKDGVVVGVHDGYPLYTIGQKKGLNSSVAGCVIGIDPNNNRLIIGSNDNLYHHNLIVENYNITDMNELLTAQNISVMIRGYGHNPTGYATITHSDNKLHVTLSNPAWALSAGQPVVFYIENRLIGGGILENYY